jgi:hypothetical protein
VRWILQRSAATLAVLFLFFGPALLAARVARAFDASADLTSWIALAVFLGANYLFFLGGVYERIERES